LGGEGGSEKTLDESWFLCYTQVIQTDIMETTMTSKKVASASTPTTIRLDPYYIVGCQLVVKRKMEEGFSFPNRSDIIKTGLEKVFLEYGITPDDIKKELKEKRKNTG